MKCGHAAPLIKLGQNMEVVRQKLASVTNTDTDYDISLLSQQIEAESIKEPVHGTDYEYDTFKANINNYLVEKVTYQLGNTHFLTFFKCDALMMDLLNEIDDFLHVKQTSLYIDTSALGGADGIGVMIIDLVCNYVIAQNDVEPFVSFIDEVQCYTKSQYSESEYRSGLTLVDRERRKNGIFLFLTS